MGCIVNGPGEMADADFGYVGGAPDKIDLYVGKVWVIALHTLDIVFFKVLKKLATKILLYIYTLQVI